MNRRLLQPLRRVKLKYKLLHDHQTSFPVVPLDLLLEIFTIPKVTGKTWTCARHSTLSRMMSLSLNWKDMDLTDGPLVG